MVKINYCPSCGNELSKGSFICPSCNLDIEELFARGYLLACNEGDNSIELFEGNIDDLIIDDMEDAGFANPDISINSADELVIVVPENGGDDELVIDFDELGIDVEELGEDVNIIIQVEAPDGFDEEIIEVEDFIEEPNQWFFDDDPYGIVYYEFAGDYKD